jgi:hypothetical protein
VLLRAVQHPQAGVYAEKDWGPHCSYLSRKSLLTSWLLRAEALLMPTRTRLEVVVEVVVVKEAQKMRLRLFVFAELVRRVLKK